ncbi:MAG: sialidase family protein [Planctomycetota bacterium]
MRHATVFLASVMLLGFGAAWGAENLLANPSFEEGEIGARPPRWGQAAYAGKESNLPAPFAAAPGGHAGDKCAVVEVPENMQWSLIDQHLNVPTDLSKGLLLSAWLRSEDPEGKVDLVIFVAAPKRKAYDLAQVRLGFTDIGKEWKHCQAALSLEEAVGVQQDDELLSRAIIQVYAPHRKVYVDDVSFTVVDAGTVNASSLSAVPERYREGVVDSVTEAVPIILADGKVALFYTKGGNVIFRASKDDGKSWGSRTPCLLASGQALKTGDCHPVRLKSGKLGLVLHDKYMLKFSVSEDEGASWSEPVAVNPSGPGGKPLNGAPFVTSAGRIIVPVWNIPPELRPLWSKPGFAATICWLSDDEGKTWRRSQTILSEKGEVKAAFEEAVGVELPDGKLMLFARTPMARIFKCYSSDGGETWTKPEPTPLVSSYAPCALGRMPNGDLLAVWNQSSIEEVKQTFRRHRLTCAVSSDDGETWFHHRNLESLDDVTKIDEDVNWNIFDFEHEPPYKQPTDAAKYPHAPAPLRCAYPAAAFTKNAAVIVYDYGSAVGIFPGQYLKVRSLPYEWFYENP